VRLLVADDNPGYRLLGRTALADVHDLAVVAEVTDVQGVHDAVAAAKPDVALLDLLLPGGGAFAAVQALQQLAPEAAAIVSSAHSMEELDAAGHTAGVAFLSKGVSPFRLADEIVERVHVLVRSEPPLEEVSLKLPQVRESSSAARRFAADTLATWGCSDLVETAKLLISELVSNAVLHAGSDVDVSLHLRTDCVRFEVGDHSARPMRRRQAGEEDTSGRGSELIDMLAHAWGMRGRADGKAIWFELVRTPEEA
jgi:DNA-binding NarL/FixJ family response regulator